MILIIDNFDSFTHNIYQQLLQVTDQEVRVIRNNKIDLEGIKELNPDRIIISPGPGRPEDAGISLDVIKEFAGKVPILGVCLGHQAIIHCFGGEIISAKNIVHGKVELMSCDGKGLFRNLEKNINFTRYHSLVGNPKNLPDCLEVTSTSFDGEIMGVRHKTLDIEGVQFHPESIASESGLNLFRNFINYKREPYNVKAMLEKIILGQDLSFLEASGFMEELTDGNLSDPIIAGFLIALNCKGITSDEIAGCASVLRRKKIGVETKKETLDTCGTGGDGLNTFNISSFSALLASSCGASVAKHGNRAVSSKSGSADFYGELGIPLNSDPIAVSKAIDNYGFGFLFAPHFHKAMAHAAGARKALGLKSIMNLIGPLSNPASAEFQIIGVWNSEYCEIMAHAAKKLGVKRVMVVHGFDGLDEISISDKTKIVFIDENDKEESYIFDPREQGIKMYPVTDLLGGSGKENAQIARNIMDNKGHEAIKEACCLNAGAALMVSNIAPSIKDGYIMAKKSLEEGHFVKKIREIVNGY